MGASLHGRVLLKKIKTMRKSIAIQYSPSPKEKGLGVEVKNTALENERWFERDFIPSGFFHDLRDGFNLDEPWDLVQGVSIRQTYNALTPQATNLCNYQSIFMSQTPRFNFGEMNDIWQYNLPANFAFCNQ